MIKIYYLFLTMLLGMVVMTANAEDITVTVNVDDASRVGVQIYSYDSYMLEKQEVVVGSNTYTVNQYAQVKIYAKEGALLSSVKEAGIVKISEYKTDYSTYPGSDVTLDVTSVKEDDVYSASFQLTIDNPAAVRAMFESSYRDITLSAGDNTVKYNPETETRLMISPSGGAPLYRVLNNDVAVEPQGSTYYYITTAGAKVKVESVWPENVKFSLGFDFADEDSKGFISSVSVNGSPIENFANGVEIQGGSQVSITGNSTEYALDEFKVNGASTSFGYGQYNFYITENVKLGVKAHKLGSINFTLNADDPSNFVVYNGYTYENNSMAITEGNNALSVSEGGNKCITIVANEGCYLTSVNDGTQDLSVSGGSCIVNVTEGMTITVKSGKIVRDKTATINVYGRDKADRYFSFCSNSDRSLDYSFVEGENELKFCDSDLSFNFGCYGSTIGQTNKIYLNGYLAQTYYGQYQLNFDNGATIDIVLDPAKFEKTEKKVSFTLGENITYSSATVTFPGGEAYNWSTEGLVTVNDANYEVTLTPAYGVAIAVSVDGNAVTANTEGAFVFTVKPTSNVTVYDPATGLNSINAENADNSFYTLQGVKVNGKAKGLYIKNGKKVVVK